MTGVGERSWPLLPVPDRAGRLAFPDVDASVRQSIEVILRTRPGERLLRPSFGAGLERWLDEPNTVATRSAIRDEITAALTDGEPRVVLDDVQVAADERTPTTVRIRIDYRLRRTGEGRRVALGLELGG